MDFSFLYGSNPSEFGQIGGGLMRFRSLSANLLKSDIISKLLMSFAEGINVNPLLSSKVSETNYSPKD